MTILALLCIVGQLLDPGSVARFADHLYVQGDYAAALDEYRRFAFLSDSAHDETAYRIVECLVLTDRLADARRAVADLTDGPRKEFATGAVLFESGQYDSARIVLSRVPPPYVDAARKVIGLSHAREYRFRDAQRYIPLPGPVPPHRSPWLAAALALLPGAGHWYAGRPADGLYGLLVCSTTSLAGYYYYDHDEAIKGGIALAVAVLFYAGNIYGAANAAMNFNDRRDEAYLRLIEVSLD